MREVVLDTETTGLDPASGHKIIEIGCVEMVNGVVSGRTFQRYVNPERDIPADAEAVHGISADMLADKPIFADVADDLLAFLGEDRLVIHNADFDLGFLNAELAAAGRPAIDHRRGIDTVTLARKKFPGSPANLDALCKRFNIDNSRRTKHGALLDAELLAEVYVELTGGRQQGLTLVAAAQDRAGSAVPTDSKPRERPVRTPRPHEPSETELAAHDALIGKLVDPIWRR